MHQSGITSVTFRTLSVEKIMELCEENRLQGIEWGSDVHLLKGEVQKAIQISECCASKELKIYAYATYYKLMQGLDPVSEFGALLEIAVALKAPVIRIWAGRTASFDVDEEFYQQAAKEARILCDMAAEFKIVVAFEYHRKSLTDNASSALKLIRLIDRDNVKLYWQPNPELSLKKNLEELKQVRHVVVQVHAFSWNERNERFPLKKHEKQWLQYLLWIPQNCPILLEFIQNDSMEQFYKDALTLNEWCNKS